MNKIFATLLFLVSTLSHAGEVIYRCKSDVGGSTVYQSTPCGPKAELVKVRPENRAQLMVNAMESGVLLPVPAPSPSPPRPPDSSMIPNPAVTSPAPSSFRCITADGRTFYRHDACPAASPVVTTVQVQGRRGIRQVKKTEFAPVSAAPVSREQACKEIQSSRRSSAMDEKYSTYERNLGRDPCR
jgi:hypothetical protein